MHDFQNANVNNFFEDIDDIDLDMEIIASENNSTYVDSNSGM